MGRGASEEPTNALRSDWAGDALDAYARLTFHRPFGALVGEDKKTCLCDLLTDLQHLARRDGLDFEHALASAQHHHAAEARFGWNEQTG